MPLLDKVLSVLAPHDCVVCGREGSILCGWCGEEACEPIPARCYKCQKATSEFAVCKTDRRKTKLRYLWVCGEYKSTAKLLIHKLKFERAGAETARLIADYLDDTVPFLNPKTIITYIPTATSRQRQRGYDQAALIAKAFAKKRGLTNLALLFRLGQSRQVGAKRTDRRQQLEGVFGTRHDYLIKNARLLIIDDVLTTGATMEQAALVLKRAGAKEINGAVFTQAR